MAIALVRSRFAARPDLRASNAARRLADVLAVALLAVLGGADDYPGIVEFGLDLTEPLGGLLAPPPPSG